MTNASAIMLMGFSSQSIHMPATGSTSWSSAVFVAPEPFCPVFLQRSHRQAQRPLIRSLFCERLACATCNQAEEPDL